MSDILRGSLYALERRVLELKNEVENMRMRAEAAERREEHLREANVDLQRRLSHLRPLTDEEWQVVQREHDVLYAARQIANAVGEINAPTSLLKALKAYDEALATVSREARVERGKSG